MRDIGDAPTDPATTITDDERTAPDAPPTGSRIGRFDIGTPLGAGGMGVVVAAHDRQLDRPVALKLLRSGVGDHYRARLLREAQAMARIDHPNVVSVYDVGAVDGRLYVAMELVEGTTLGKWMASAPRTWRDIVAMFVQAGEGLAAVHRAGLVHRDFKPDNVMVDARGRARLTDFGLARLDSLDGATPERAAMAVPLTRTGAMLGTPGYMAPEQQYGSMVDSRADQYSFCAGLKRALPDAVPAALRAVIARGVSFDADDRYSSMEVLLVALRAATRPRRTGVIVAVTGFATGAIVVASIVAAGGTAKVAAVVAADAAPAIDAPAVVVAVDTIDAPPIVAAAVDAGAKARRDARAVVADVTPAPAPMSPSPPAIAVDAPPSADATPLGLLKLPITLTAEIADDDSNPRIPDAVLDDTPPAGQAPDASTKPAMSSSRLTAIRAAARAAGYAGLDLADVRADPATHEAALRVAVTRLAAEGDAGHVITLQIARTALAMTRRLRGDCSDARSLAAAAVKGFNAAGSPFKLKREAALWYARAWFVGGLCRIAGEQIDDAGKYIAETNATLAHHNAPAAERAEAQLMLGILAFEDGRPKHADAWLSAATKHGSIGIKKAVAGYRKAAGLP